MIQKILILCIGNICRSPMAWALCKQKFETNHSVAVDSAGLAAVVGGQADPTSCSLMLERGLDISSHRAKQVTADMIYASDIIWTMTTEQQEQVHSDFPFSRGRVFRLGQWLGVDIVDPFKRPVVIFEQALNLIEQSLDEWYKKL
ncbi:MAG: low molecular weight protein-tyrosine-phosphatase [Legionellaceae bacterium]|nr:low molecular weight protein-tyrosine-phosphatase [Legionellaceae bacterium]